MKVEAFVPTGHPMVSSRRALRSRRLRAVAALVGAVAVLGGAVSLAAPGTAQAPGVEEAEPEVVTPITRPDGTPDPSAQGALDATLALAPDDSPPMPDDPFVLPIELRKVERRELLALYGATQRSDLANLAAYDAADRAREAQDAEDEAREQRNARASELRHERGRLKNLTVRAYVSGGDYEVEGQQAMLEGDTTDPIAGRMIVFEQVIDRQYAATQLATDAFARAGVALRKATAARVVADRRFADATGVASALDRERLDAEGVHQRALANFEESVRRLRNAPRNVPAPIETPLIGDPRLNAADLASWFEASPYRSRIATPIADIAAWFIEEGRAEGIRGDVAFVQAVLETGGFTNGDSVERHNYSGIGHYDNLAAGWAFPSAREGVRAQIQLLKSYAVRQPQYAQPLVERRLRGPAGCCRTWGDLTRRWATDPTYGPKVMLLYTSLVDHALGRRAAGEDLDVP